MRLFVDESEVEVKINELTDRAIGRIINNRHELWYVDINGFLIKKDLYGKRNVYFL